MLALRKENDKHRLREFFIDEARKLIGSRRVKFAREAEHNARLYEEDARQDEERAVEAERRARQFEVRDHHRLRAASRDHGIKAMKKAIEDEEDFRQFAETFRRKQEKAMDGDEAIMKEEDLVMLADEATEKVEELAKLAQQQTRQMFQRARCAEASARQAEQRALEAKESKTPKRILTICLSGIACLTLAVCYFIEQVVYAA